MSDVGDVKVEEFGNGGYAVWVRVHEAVDQGMKDDGTHLYTRIAKWLCIESSEAGTCGEAWYDDWGLDNLPVVGSVPGSSASNWIVP